MEKNSSVSTPVVKKLPEITMKDKIYLNISEKAFVKIAFLLQRIHDVEWSALLFYTATGYVDKPTDMKITVEDIYLMDKGTAATTTHTYDDTDVAQAYIDYPQYEDMKLGHIHSHNNMSVFFSGTDMQELHDNTENHLYYLSMIVNNKGDVCAKVSYIGKRELKSKYSFKNKLGNWIKRPTVVVEEEEVLVVHDCSIYFSFIDAPDFVKRYTEVNSRVKPVTTTYHSTTYGGTSNYPAKKTGVLGSENKWEKETYSRSDYSAPTDWEKQNKLAKMLVLTEFNADKPLWQLVEKANQVYMRDSEEVIQESYKAAYESYSIGDNDISSHFITLAYQQIYSVSFEQLMEDEVLFDKFLENVSMAVSQVTGKILIPVREVVEDYLLDMEECNQLYHELAADNPKDELKSITETEDDEINQAIKRLNYAEESDD